MDRETQSHGQPGKPERGRPAWRGWAIGAVGLVLIVFIAQNSQKVEVDFIVATTSTPLVFALLIATMLGTLIGWLAPRLRRHKDD